MSSVRGRLIARIFPSAAPLPAPLAAYQPSQQEIRQARATLSRMLTDNIAPFWQEAAIDREGGGYRLNHDLSGRWKGPSNKRCIMQARTLWFFARLARSEFGTSEHLEAARHGYAFLRDRMWDARYGGLFWELDASGRR